MSSLSGPQYQDALPKVGRLCQLRRSNMPEEEIVKQLGFGSVEAMHGQLANWEMPDWIIGGAPSSSEQDEQERRARTASEEPTEFRIVEDPRMDDGHEDHAGNV